ncbi:MAG: MFS transporter [Kofleriaceae bacterium]|jgi:MFS family permease|nr:MFS transporter [Kofleriaceae bacterium]MBP6841297.1 MFS transporter [Kofleriaceae bacterium]MBP9207118.1 MFS transporter [Kofleriaceae bacterium]
MARDLRLFYLFRLLATSYLYVPIFMLFQEARGLSFFERLALGGLYSAVVVLVEVPTGVMADRIGRRRSMMLGAMAMVGSCLLAYRADGFVDFAVAEGLAALSMALCSGADSAYLFDLLAENNAAHEYGRRESVASAWHLIGSALAFAGGGLLAQVELGLPYLVTAGVAASAVVVAAMLRDDRPAVRPGGRAGAGAVMMQYFGQVRSAVGQVGRSPRMMWLVGYSAVVFVLLRATVYLYQPYLRGRGFGLVEIGLLFAGVYLVASVVAYRTHVWRRRLGDDSMLWLLLGGLAVSFLLLGWVRGPWVIALLGVQAVATGLYSPLTKPLLNQEITDSSRRAAVLSVESMVRRAAMGVFAPLAGLYGEASVLDLCGAIGLIGLFFLALTQARRHAAAPVAGAAVPSGPAPTPAVATAAATARSRR